jgi:hypothetical protein
VTLTDPSDDGRHHYGTYDMAARLCAQVGFNLADVNQRLIDDPGFRTQLAKLAFRFEPLLWPEAPMFGDRLRLACAINETPLLSSILREDEAQVRYYDTNAKGWLPIADASTVNHLLQAEVLGTLVSVLDDLERTVVIRSFGFEGPRVSYRDQARRCGISAPVVKYTLERALRKMRRQRRLLQAQEALRLSGISAMSLSALGLLPNSERLLEAHSIYSVDSLVNLGREGLGRLSGVGPVTIDNVEQRLVDHGMILAD